MNNTYHLTDPETGKITIITLVGDKYTVENITSGKSRITEKSFPSAGAAEVNFEKKAWEILKKGMIMKQEAMAAGEARYHRFIGTPQSGFSLFANTPEGIYVYKSGYMVQEYLVLLNHSGDYVSSLPLPESDLWDLQYSKSSDSLIFIQRKEIREYDLQAKKFNALYKIPDFESFIAAGESYSAYGASPDLYIRSQSDNSKVTQITMNGKFGAISKSGKVIATIGGNKEIIFIDQESGEIISTLLHDMDHSSGIQFYGNDAFIVVKAGLHYPELRFFDVAKAVEIKYPGLKIPNGIVDFCFNETETKLAYIRWNGQECGIVDFADKKRLCEFDLRHVIKKGSCAFIGEDLAVYTDYGCFSLYATGKVIAENDGSDKVAIEEIAFSASDLPQHPVVTLFDEFSDAAMYGDFDKVKEYIANDPEIIHLADDHGFTVLHQMMSEEEFEILDYLLAQGADPNVKNHDGIAPLHLACYPKNADLLLKYGADIHIRSNMQETPLHVYASEGSESHAVAKFLIGKGADRNLLNNANQKPVDISRRREDRSMIKLLEGN